MSDLFSTGLSGLNVARTALVTTAHNTANVYTPGYSRQTAIVASNGGTATGAGFIGSGAGVATVARSYDSYLTAQLVQADSSVQELDTYSTQIGRIDNLLADNTTGLASLMQGFFTGVQAVADTPADPAARQQMLSSAQAMAGKFQSVDQYLTDLNTSVNDEIKGQVDQVNTYATQIASLNHQIGQLSAAAGGQPPNDLLDQRDQLVSSLGKIIGINVVQQDGGQYNVFVGAGQSLVLGDRAMQVKAVASAADPTREAVALAGYSGNAVEINDKALTGGSLGGLMAFRSEALVPTQNAVGRVAMVLASAFNDQHALGVDLKGTPGADFFTQAAPVVFASARNSGNMVLTSGVFDVSQLTGSDYSIDVTSVAGTPTYSVTRLADGKNLGSFTSMPNGFDGVTVDIASGTAQPGDSFLVQPTRAGARDLNVLVTDPAQVAAASPVITGNTSGNRGSGRIGAATVDASYLATPLAGTVTLAYDATTGTLSGFPAAAAVTVTPPGGGASTTYAAGAPVPYTAGASMSFGGITMRMDGAPSQGDTFTVAKNTGGVSDGSNALMLGALQGKALVAGGTATLSETYAQLVSSVGNRTMQAQVAQTTQTSLAGQIRASQQAISGVNQDEETANLLMFQQMYQANAKVIQTASTVFDAILALN